MFNAAQYGAMTRTMMLLSVAVLPSVVMADSFCGPSDSQYPNQLAGRLEHYAAKVTPTGRFAVKKEYPGSGELFIISFVDKGRTVFTYREKVDGVEVDPDIRPMKGHTRRPGLTVVLLQGKLGACEYDILPHGNTFTVTSKGFKN